MSHSTVSVAKAVVVLVALSSALAFFTGPIPAFVEAAPIPNYTDAAVTVWQHKDAGSSNWNVAYSVLARGPATDLAWYSLHASNKAAIIADLPGADRRPNVAVDWQGARAMAVWDHETVAGDATSTDIWWSMWRGQVLGWTAPASVGALAGADVDPAVAFDRDGKAMVVWNHQQSDGKWVNFFARFDGTSAFGASASIGAGQPGDASLPEIAFTVHPAASGGGKEALLAWVDNGPSASQKRVFFSVWNGATWTAAAEIPNQSANGMNTIGSGRESFTRIGVSTDVAGDSFVVWGGEAYESTPGSVHVASAGVTGAKWDGSSWLYPLNAVFFGSGGCHTPAAASDPQLNTIMVYPYGQQEEYSRRIGDSFTYESVFNSGPLNDLRAGTVSVGEEFATVWWGLDANGLDNAEVWWGYGVPDENNANNVIWSTPSRVETTLAGGLAGEDRYPEIDSMIGGRTRPLICDEVTVTAQSPAAGIRYVNGAAYSVPSLAIPEVFGSPLPVQVTLGDPTKIGSLRIALDASINVVYSAILPTTAVHAFPLTTTGLPEGLHVLTVTATTKTGCMLPPIQLPFLVTTPSMSAVAIGEFASFTAPEAPEIETRGAYLPNHKTGGERKVVTAHVDLPQHPLLGKSWIEGVNQYASGNVSGSVADLRLADHSRVDIAEVFLFNGLVRAKAIHNGVRTTLDVATQAASADSSEFSLGELRVGGVPVALGTIPENTVIALPPPFAGRVVLRETLDFAGAGYAERIVNALHVFVVLPGTVSEIEVIIGQAQAGSSVGSTFVGPSRDIYRQNDAGTGADVGGTLATAHALAPPFALVGGRFAASDSVDVYSIPAAHGEKVTAVVKPSNDAYVGLNPVVVDGTNMVLVPAPPLPISPPVVSATNPTVGAVTPDVRLELISPTGSVRETSNLPLSSPEKVELNVDNAIAGNWYLRITSQSAGGGNYTLEVHVTPVPLFDQIDGQGATLELPPHDAPSACTTASLTLPNGVPVPGVLRDDDVSDVYLLPAAVLGDSVKVVMKPEEGTDGADFDLRLFDPECQPLAELDAGVMIVGVGPLTRGESRLGKDLGFEGDVPKGVPDVVFDMPVTKEGQYRVEVRRMNGVANYYLQASVTTPIPNLPANDAGSGDPTQPFAESDAPDVCSAPLPLPILPNNDPRPGPYEGTFQTRADNYDHYAFPAKAGDRITIAVVPGAFSDVDATLFTLGCTSVLDTGTLASQAPAGPTAPETLSATAPATGVYVLRVARVLGGGNYLFSVLNDRYPGPDAPAFRIAPVGEEAEPPSATATFQPMSEEELAALAASVQHDVLCNVITFPTA